MTKKTMPKVRILRSYKGALTVNQDDFIPRATGFSIDTLQFLNDEGTWESPEVVIDAESLNKLNEFKLKWIQ